MKVLFLENNKSSVKNKLETALGKNSRLFQSLQIPIDSMSKGFKGYAEIRKVIDDEHIDTIVCDKKGISLASRLLWQERTIKRYILVGVNSIFELEESNTRAQEILWNMIANKTAKNAIERGGWISSITGRAFTNEEMQEYTSNVEDKLNEYVTKDSEIVEIGIASGLTCMRLAPKVKKYYGIDISDATINKTEQDLLRAGITNFELFCDEALCVSALGIPKVDLVIMNSVCQYFSGYNYFFSTIERCIDIMKDNGIIFVGDILDYSRIREFDKELEAVNGRRNLRDLWYPNSIFEALPSYFPYIKEVSITEKRGKVNNELKKYRQDILLIVKKEHSVPKQKSYGKYCYAYNGDTNLEELASKYGDDEFREVLNGKNCY